MIMLKASMIESIYAPLYQYDQHHLGRVIEVMLSSPAKRPQIIAKMISMFDEDR
jgi:hypothetical protein